MSAEATGWVWRHSPWKGQHAKLLIHLAVADVVNDAHGNEFWMAYASLAEKVGCGTRVVASWFAESLERGLVELVEDNSRRGRANRYRLLLGEGGTHSVHGGYALSAGGGTHSVHTELKEELKGTTSIEVVDDADDSATAIAGRVLAAWVDATGRDPRRVKLNAKRLREVKARLREGYSEGDLVAAARGIALSPWHMGDNPEGKKYDDLAVAIRDGGRVEKFRDLFDRGGDARPRSAVDRLAERLQASAGGPLPLPGGE